MSDAINNITALKRRMKLLLLANRAPFLKGDRGLGKTETVFQVVEELRNPTDGQPKLSIEGVYYLNASQTDPEAMTFPVVKTNEEGRKTVEVVTVEDLEGHLVFIDELTNSNERLRSFLLSLVASRRVGAREFGNIWFAAAGNEMDHSTLASSMPRPLLERFCVLDFPTPTRDEWIRYMRTFYPQVPAYYYGFVKTIAENQFYQAETEGGDVEDFRQIPSPRSHTYAASVLMHYPTAQEAKANIYDVQAMFEGFVGNGVAAAFAAYLQDASNFLTYAEYQKGRKPENSAQLINLTVSAADALDKVREEGDFDSYAEGVSEVLADVVSVSSLRNLKQFVIDTFTSGGKNSLKLELSRWCSRQDDPGPIAKILDERRSQTMELNAATRG